MKKNITFCLVLFSSFLMKAQIIAPFADIGSKWTYNFFSYGLGSGYTSLEFTKDTLIRGINCRQVQQKMIYTACDFGVGCSSSSSKTEHFFQRNDSLFQFDSNNDIQFIFNYRCRVRDSFRIIIPPPANPYYVTVLRIGDTILNGNRFKFWELGEYCQGRLSYQYFHFEKILSSRLATNSASIGSFCRINAHFVQTLCNFSSGLFQYNPIDCKTTALQELATNIHVSPNPSSNELLVESPMSFDAEYNIYNVNGQSMQKGHCREGTQLDISILSSGLYFLKLINNKTQTIIRFIKY